MGGAGGVAVEGGAVVGGVVELGVVVGAVEVGGVVIGDVDGGDIGSCAPIMPGAPEEPALPMVGFERMNEGAPAGDAPVEPAISPL